MSKENQVTEVLRLEGIMAQGYGLNPKLVMRDKRLSPEAKCIYAYFSSFAGAGNQAFPSRDLMLDELNMSIKRYYKYLKELLECDYIRIERCKTSDHKFDKNIYTIVALPNPIENPTEKLECITAGKTGSEIKRIKKIKVKEKASILMLKEQLDVIALKEQMPKQSDLIDDILISAEDMMNSEQINIGGTIKRKEAIHEILSKLNSDHVRYIIYNILQNKSKIIHKKAYLQSCIYNSVFNIENIVLEAVKEREQEKVVEKSIQRKEELAKKLQAEQYSKFPKLKEIDDEILECSKKLALSLFSNKESYKTIKEKLQELEKLRNKFMTENQIDEVS